MRTRPVEPPSRARSVPARALRARGHAGACRRAASAPVPRASSAPAPPRAPPQAQRGRGSARRAVRAGSRTRAVRTRRARARTGPLLALVGAARALALGGQRVLRRLGGHHRVLDLAEAGDEVGPLPGLEHGERLLPELAVGAEHRLEADME